MRYVLVVIGMLALAAGAAFAGKNLGEVVKTEAEAPGDGGAVDCTIKDKPGAELATFTCSEVGEGGKDLKVWWLDPEHMPAADEKVYFTWGTQVQEGAVESNVVGLAQIQNFNPAGGATITLKVYLVGHVANRLQLGSIKAADIVPVANVPGEWGSVVNTSGLKGEEEANLPGPKYLDLTEYGAKVDVNTTDYTATITWTYNYAGAKAFRVPNGQLDIGLFAFSR